MEDRRRQRFVTRGELEEILEELLERVVMLMEASQAQNQAQIDSETAKVQATDAKLVEIQAAVDALKNAQQNGQTLDFTQLDQALATSDTQADTDLADAGGVPTPGGSVGSPGAPAA